MPTLNAIDAPPMPEHTRTTRKLYLRGSDGTNPNLSRGDVGAIVRAGPSHLSDALDPPTISIVGSPPTQFVELDFPATYPCGEIYVQVAATWGGQVRKWWYRFPIEATLEQR